MGVAGQGGCGLGDLRDSPQHGEQTPAPGTPAKRGKPQGCLCRQMRAALPACKALSRGHGAAGAAGAAGTEPD